MNALLEEIANDHLKKDIPDFEVGDTVRVHVRIIEGDKERMQALTGTVIARKGAGVGETFSICRVAYGVSMERVFPLHSPRVAKIEVMRKGKTRRSKLYFLRGAQGKKARLAERIMTGVKKEKAPAEAPKAEEPKEQEAKAEAPKAEEPKEQEAKAEAPKAEEPKEQEAKAEAPKTEEPKKPKAKKAEAEKPAEEPKAPKAKKAEPKAKKEIPAEEPKKDTDEDKA